MSKAKFVDSCTIARSSYCFCYFINPILPFASVPYFTQSPCIRPVHTITLYTPCSHNHTVYALFTQSPCIRPVHMSLYLPLYTCLSCAFLYRFICAFVSAPTNGSPILEKRPVSSRPVSSRHSYHAPPQCYRESHQDDGDSPPPAHFPFHVLGPRPYARKCSKS